ISTEDQDIEDKCIDNCVFNHFKKLKVDISYAITRIFPFLERLRDHEVITNKLYEDSQESFRNLLQKVVYNVLNELEKTFNPEVLKEVFSEANMMEYPGLIPIYESFRNVVPDQSYLQESDEEARMEGPSSQLSLEQGTDESSIPSLTPSHSDSPISTGTIPPENGLLEQFCETQQVKRRRKGETRDKNDALGSQEANQQCAQKPEPAESCEPVVNNGDAENETPRPARCDEQKFGPGAEVPNQGIPIKPCVVSLVDIKKEKTFFNSDVEQQDQARTNHKQESDMIDISSEDTEESSDEDKHSAMESIPVTSNYDSSESNEGEDIQEATCSRSQTAPGEDLDAKPWPEFKHLWLKRVGCQPHMLEVTHSNPAPANANVGGLENKRHNTQIPHTQMLTAFSRFEPSQTERRKNNDFQDTNQNLSQKHENKSTLFPGIKVDPVAHTDYKRHPGIPCTPISYPHNLMIPKQLSTASPTQSLFFSENKKFLGYLGKLSKFNGKARRSSQKSSAITCLERLRKRGRPRINVPLSDRGPGKRYQKTGKKKNIKRIKPQRKLRISRFPRDENINFQLPELPVTCGDLKGTLHKKKLKQGSPQKSIQTENGRWLTPREFEIKGGYEQSKKWKHSIRCGRYRLQDLMEKGVLPNPPKPKRKVII
uniref:SP100 nuclear antigen n=1 Tax=Otolemur garnettii TaxID=30611 RepID=H0XSZ1_OTOGA